VPRPTLHPLVHDALIEAIVERLEAALDISTEANTVDLVRQHQRWISLLNAADDIAALARSLEIFTRPSR